MRLTVSLLLAGLLLCCYGSCSRADSTTELALRHMCGPSAVRLAPLVWDESRRNLLSPVSLVAVMATESRCRSGVVNPVSGAAGLLQILPGGSADGGYPPDELIADDLSVKLGARHLARCLQLCGAWAGALGVYNGGRYCRASRYAKRVLAIERSFWRWLHPPLRARVS